MNNHAHPHNNTGFVGALRLVPSGQGEADTETDVSARDVVGAYARQAGELAAMVETAMTAELARHAAAMRSLRTVAAALAEHDGQLTALAARLGGGDQ